MIISLMERYPYNFCMMFCNFITQSNSRGLNGSRIESTKFSLQCSVVVSACVHEYLDLSYVENTDAYAADANNTDKVVK